MLAKTIITIWHCKFLHIIMSPSYVLNCWPFLQRVLNATSDSLSGRKAVYEERTLNTKQAILFDLQLKIFILSNYICSVYLYNGRVLKRSRPSRFYFSQIASILRKEKTSTLSYGNNYGTHIIN